MAKDVDPEELEQKRLAYLRNIDVEWDDSKTQLREATEEDMVLLSKEEAAAAAPPVPEKVSCSSCDQEVLSCAWLMSLIPFITARIVGIHARRARYERLEVSVRRSGNWASFEASMSARTTHKCLYSQSKCTVLYLEYPTGYDQDLEIHNS